MNEIRITGEGSLESVHGRTRSAYDAVADRYHELFRDELIGKEYDRDLLDEFARSFGVGGRVLDAGCGPCGHVSRYLRNRGLAVVGVDLSVSCLRTARRCQPLIPVAAGDLARLPFGSSVFAGVVAYYSLIHTPKRFLRRLLQEFRRTLASGGRLLLAVKEGTSEGYEPELLGAPVPIYFSRFTLEEMARVLEGGGFRVERLERRDPYDFEIAEGRIFAVARGK
ncbi:MAG: class I SAM-dependent methyltransferase [Acidobacteriota bacterium]